MRRPLIPVVLLLLGIVGSVLVVTGGEAGVDLERIVTAEGVEVDIPFGWEAVDERPFEFRPPPELARPTDRWLVAWACGPSGCGERPLEEWLEIGETLPSFVGARDDVGELLFDLRETTDETSRVIVASTATGEQQVFVAVFLDGADHYLECGLSVFDDEDGLVDEIIRACRAATPPTR